MFWNLNLGFCNLLCAFFIFLPYRCGLGASTLLMLFGKESENWREFWLQQMLECDLARATLSQNHRHAYRMHITTIGSPLFRGLVRGTQRAGAAFQKFLGFKMSTWKMKRVNKNENAWTDNDIPAMLESFLLLQRFGQWLSMRPDMFPPDVIVVLSKLRADAPAHSGVPKLRCDRCERSYIWKRPAKIQWFAESVQSEDSGYMWACGC